MGTCMRLHAHWKIGNKGVMKEMDGGYGHEGLDGHVRYEVKGGKGGYSGETICMKSAWCREINGFMGFKERVTCIGGYEILQDNIL